LASPRMLFIDIETAPIIMASWTLWEASAVWVERDTYIMSVAARWSDQKRTQTFALPDYPRYKRHRHDDKDLCRELFKMLDAADIVVAHNGDAFDIKKINSRLIVNGLKPPSPYKTIDTLKIARRVFKFDSNKLDNIGRYLGEGRKLPNTGAALWRGCVDGDERSWRIMRRYNAKDVDLLVAAYERLKGWAPNHPDLRLYDNRPGCPTCRSSNVIRRGYIFTKARKLNRFQCRDCASWFSGGTAK
jgi:DNA polymerase elongation subunit (family B)